MSFWFPRIFGRRQPPDPANIPGLDELRRQVTPTPKPKQRPKRRNPLDIRANVQRPKTRDDAKTVLQAALRSTRLQRAWQESRLTDAQSVRLGLVMARQQRQLSRMLANDLISGKITADRYRDRMADQIAANHIAQFQAVNQQVAIRGPERDAIEQNIRDQFERLEKLTRGLKSGKIPRDGRIISRSLGYVTSGWAGAQNTQVQVKEREGFKEYRSVLGVADNCEGCLEQARRGWRPIGSLVPIGQRTCNSNCRCRFVYRIVNKRRKSEARKARQQPQPTIRLGTIVSDIEDKIEAIRFVGRLIGWPNATPESIAKLAGAPANATVEIESPSNLLGFHVQITGDGYKMEREIVESGTGKPTLRNVSFEVESSHQGKGLGTQVFDQQVKTAAELGLNRIQTHAAKGDGLVGYKVWPKLGYDADIPSDLRIRLPESLANSQRISDLMRTPEGRRWWDANGVGVDVTFDLSPGSQSRQTWDAYLAERQRQRQQ